jgi:hypothetical protein
MKYVNRIRKCSDIDYPERTGPLANTDLTRSCAYCGHWSPITRVEPALYPIQLVPRIPPGVCGETPEIVQRTAQEDYWLHALPISVLIYDIGCDFKARQNGWPMFLFGDGSETYRGGMRALVTIGKRSSGLYLGLANSISPRS